VVVMGIAALHPSYVLKRPGLLWINVRRRAGFHKC